MKRFLSLVLAGAMATAMITTVASADSAKGQKLYSKKLKKACAADGIANGAKFAAKYTQSEWEAVGAAGMKAEIKKLCPSANTDKIKEKYIKDIYDFAHHFGSDSGNVPSC